MEGTSVSDTQVRVKVTRDDDGDATATLIVSPAVARDLRAGGHRPIEVQKIPEQEPTMPEHDHDTVRYAPSAQHQLQITNQRVYRQPTADQRPRYEWIRAAIADLMYEMAVRCPSSRELSLALTDLDNAGMHANQAIARNE